MEGYGVASIVAGCCGPDNSIFIHWLSGEPIMTGRVHSKALLVWSVFIYLLFL